MFQDVALGSIGFKSRCTMETTSVVTATDAIAVTDNSTEPLVGFADNAAQTEPKATATTTTKSSKDAKNAAGDAESDDTMARALAFVQRVGPLMLREMRTNATTSSFFRGFEKHLEESMEKSVAKLFQLQFDYDTFFQAPTQAQATTANDKTKTKSDATHQTAASLQLSCTGVSWNATGASIAVAYGRFDHSGWCNYRSALCLWSVFQSDFNPLKPTLVLETSSGLMCVAYHPTNPSIVAAGSFNGEVFVWDLEPKDDYRVFASGIGDYFHREPVTNVAWVYDAQAAEYNVASVSGDGKVLFWRLKDKLAYPVEGYIMHLPTSTTTSNTSIIGGKSVAFSIADKTSRAFVVGSEAGAVARCFARSTTARASDFKGDKKWTATAAKLVGKLHPPHLQNVRRQVELFATTSGQKTKEITLATVYNAKIDPLLLFPSAMDFAFMPHAGPVYALRFSPFRKSLFASCASDGTARIYSSLQREPLVTLDVAPSASYLYAIEWSKTRPMVLAIASEDGSVSMYDLKTDRVNPTLVLRGDDPIAGEPVTTAATGRTSTTAASTTSKRASSPMFCVDFNPRQRNFLAAGDANGSVHIWKLPFDVANFQAGEAALLDAFETMNE